MHLFALPCAASLVRRVVLPFILPVILSPSCVALAAERDESAFFEDVPVVLTVSRMPQPLAEAPAAVTVIDREMIRASGARTIPDVLRLVPGFAVGWKSGHMASVSYHGYRDDYARRMQVLVDGRSVYTPFFVGGVDWASWPIALDDIETIEVVRGTNSVSYGANAFLGVVNIITRTALEGRGARFSVSRGDKNINDRTVRLGFGDQRLAARVTYGVRKDDGLDSAYDSSRTEFVNGRVDWQLTARTDLSMQAGGSRGRRGEGYAFFLDPPDTPNTFYPPHERGAGTGFAQVKLRHAFSADNELTLHYYQNRETARDRWDASFLPGVVEPQNADRLATRESIELQHVFRLAAPLRVSWGGEWRRDTLQSAYTLGTNETRSAYLSRFFVNGEWRVVQGLIVNAGAMREDESISGSNVSPRFFVNWLPTRAHAFRAGVTRGYRTPTIFEEKSDWQTRSAGLLIDQFYLSSGGLRAERVLSKEVGYFGDWRWLGGTVDVRVFDETTSDALCRIVRPLPPGTELSPEQLTYDFANCGGRPETRGYELGVKARPTQGTLVSLGYSHVYTLGAVESPAGTSLTGTPGAADSQSRAIVLTPSRLGSLLVNQRLPMRFEASVVYYRLWGERPAPSELGGAFIPSLAARPYRRIDVRLAKRFDVGSTRAEVAIVGQNIGPGTDDFVYQRQFTRRWFLTVSAEIP